MPAKTAAPFEIPYAVESDKPPSIETAMKPTAERVHKLLGEIAPGQIVGGSAGKLVIAGSTGAGAYKALKGDATLAEDGTLTIGSEKVSTTKLAAKAVTGAKLDDEAIGLPKLLKALQQAFVPTGSVLAAALVSAPEGWLICNGAAISRTTYSGLFAAIGVNFGSGDGSTTFNLPDLRGRAPVGVDGGAGRMTTGNAIGNGGGEQTHVLSQGEMPVHSHAAGGLFTNAPISTRQQTLINQYNNYSPQNGFNAVSGWALFPDSSIGGSTASIGSGSAHNNLQPYQVVNYIIKT